MSKKKIVRVFEVGAPLTEASPSEATVKRPGLLSKIEKMLGLGSGEPQEEPKKPEDDGDRHGLGLAGESASDQVIGRVFTYPGDSKRIVMFVNDATLKGNYLTKNGPQEIVKMVDKNDWKRDAVVGHTINVHPIFTPELSTEDLMNDAGSKWGPNAVLFNVKKPVWDEYVSAAGPEQKAAALAKVIDHKNYVAVLNVNAMRNSNLDDLKTDEDRQNKFDVRKFVKGYPLRAVIDQAREEWNEREANGPNTQAAEIASAADKVVKQAIKYIYSSIHKGQLKTNISAKKFDETLRGIITGAPEIKNNEQLIGLVQKEIMDKVRADNYPVGNLLKGFTQDDASFAPPAPEEQKKPDDGKKKDTVDVDALDAAAIARKLAEHPGKAKAVLKALKDYSIDV